MFFDFCPALNCLFDPLVKTGQAIAFTHKVTDAGGAVTWDVPVQLDGTISQALLSQLAALGKAFGRK